MKKENNRKENPNAEESKAALQLQMPLSEQRGEDAPNKLERVSTFKQLAKVARSSRLAFGSNGQWIQTHKLFNAGYRDGLESPPFYITKAFRYKSKEIVGPRMGIEIMMANGRSYIVGLGLNEGDIKRNGILDMFVQPNAEPIGPFVFVPLNVGKGNDYYDLQPYSQAAIQDASIEIPFVEIDEELPF
jgi:hypothetical protein